MVTKIHCFNFTQIQAVHLLPGIYFECKDLKRYINGGGVAHFNVQMIILPVARVATSKACEEKEAEEIDRAGEPIHHGELKEI